MMAQRPEHNAYPGVSNAYNHGYTYDNNYPLSTDQFQPGDASWSIDATNLHNQQAVSRAATHSPAWPPQQQQQQQPQQQHHQRPLPSQVQPTAHSTIQGYNGDAFQAQPSYAFQQQVYQQQPSYQPAQQYEPLLLAAQQRPSYDARTIAPQSLEHQRQAAASPVWPASRDLVDQEALIKSIPASQPAGLFSIINFDALVRATVSQRMSSYANIGKESSEWPITRAALPAYVARKSRNEMRKLAGNDPSLLSKISTSKRRKLASRPKIGVDGKLKTEPDDDSSDYDSDITDGSDDEPSPAAAKRPDTLKEAIEYDTILALWRGKRKMVDADDVRKALVAFWEIVKTVRDRWKTDTAAVAQAEEKGTKGELPYLKQRVQDQRDMIETAFKTALKHGNRTILETMSENTSLIFLCYQFLLDRHKAGDINGPLARAILEVMSTFNTLTEDKIEKTHLVKVLPRIIKSGDAKTQFYAKQITAKAAANKVSDKAEPTVKTEGGVKRAAAAPAANGAPVKKVAVGAVKPSAVKPAEIVPAKKRLLGDDAAKIPAKRIATEVKPELAAKAKPATNKLTGGLFAGLQSAAKKPGTSLKTAGPVTKEIPKPPAPKPVTAAPAPARPSFSLADTMKSIAKPKEEPPVVKSKEVKEVIKETAEQKAKRLRKQARGHLRVHWKPLEELVSIREFTHDPEEDMGHDSSQTRDVADLKGEGRMFKQQSHMMDLDEDDEDVKLIDWTEPLLTDFSDVIAEERKRNYSRYANGDLQPDSPENAGRARYESNTLMIFYEPGQAPANPSDPPQQGTSGEQNTLVAFGEPDKKFADRAQRPAGMTQGQIDFDKLRSTLSSLNAISTAPTPPMQQPSLDITSILAKFSSQAQQQPQMPITAPNQAWAGILPSISTPIPAQQQQQPPPSGGAPDISAILAQLTGQQQQQRQPIAPQPPPPVAAFPVMDAGFMAYVAQQQAAAAAASAGGGGVSSGQLPSSSMYENPDRMRLRDSQAD